MDKLQKRLALTKIDLDNLLNSGGIYFFNDLDSICEYYYECGITDPTAALKADLKDGSVFHEQYCFIMFA